MISGAIAISLAEATPGERDSGRIALDRECERYRMDPERVAAILGGDDPVGREAPPRRWWDVLVALVAVGISYGWDFRRGCREFP